LAIFPDLTETQPMPLPAWKKILVVDLGFLGDTVHSIPAIRALAMGGAEVEVMTTAVGAELLEMVPEVKRVWVVPLAKPSPAPWKNLGTLRSIRSQSYDVALSFVGSERNLFCTGWSAARQRIAHQSGPSSWLSRLRLTQIISSRDRSETVFEQRLSILKELGWTGANPGWSWQVPAESTRWASTVVQGPALHLSISAASSPLNEWPIDLWARALKKVWQDSPRLQVIVTGAGSEREIARLNDLASLVKDERLKIISQRQPISRILALVQAGEIHVGLDSGVLHLAMAAGKPTVSLFRESAGRLGWAPRGEHHRTIVQECPCNQTAAISCSGGRALCLSKITADEVAAAIIGTLVKHTRS
jgi:ADP-heptose:LPS heptosyltransferase